MSRKQAIEREAIIGRQRRRIERMGFALRAAKRLLANERREQFECFTMAPHKNTPEAYAAMNVPERAAIRRFDRTIAKINEALR